MLIALAVLGVDLVALAFVLAVLLSRRASGPGPEALDGSWPPKALMTVCRYLVQVAFLFHPWRVMAMRQSGRMLTLRPVHAAVGAR